jgi:hypothetical protein
LLQRCYAESICYVRFAGTGTSGVNAIEKVYQALSKLFTISATEKVYHLKT